MKLNNDLVKAKEAIQKRAELMANVVFSVSWDFEQKSKNKNIELLPCGCRSRTGYIGLEYWEDVDYKSQKPRKTPYYRLIINEEVDVYEDFPTDTWSCDHIPEVLVNYGTQEELTEFFTNYFKKKADHNEKRFLLEKFLPLFEFEVSELESFISIVKEKNLTNMDEMTYDEKTSVLKEIGIEPL